MKSKLNIDEEIIKVLGDAILGIASKTPDTPVAYAGFNVWEQVHTIALMQATKSLISRILDEVRPPLGKHGVIKYDLPNFGSGYSQALSDFDTKRKELGL